MYTYKTEGVCAKEINYNIKDGKIYDVDYKGGCPGNRIGIASLIEGMELEEVIKRLDGIECGNRGTSCPDQLSIAIKKHIKK